MRSRMPTMIEENQAKKRLESERQFHNDRFTEETRTSARKFYRTIDHCFNEYRELVSQLARGTRVLEYGCGKGENSLSMAARCAFIHGIDISDVAIDSANSTARLRGISNADFRVMNAEQLAFENCTFDVVFGSGILHHLELSAAYRELARVLKPGGSAVFVEPLGHNPLINRFRDKTPEMRTPDEHPLLKADIHLASKHFERVNVRLYGLATLAAIPVLKTGLAASVIAAGKI